jgi:DHA3 family macrolide efflux protein-like MFS transporter
MTTIPGALLNPIAGTMVDRWNRRQLIIVNHALSALSTAGLVFLFAWDIVLLWHIYGLMLIRAIGRILDNAVMLASTTLMVPQEHYSRINGFNRSIQGISSIVTPPLGALLLGILSMQNILIIDVVLSLLAIVPFLIFKIPQPMRIETPLIADQPSFSDDLREGLRLVSGWPSIMMIMLIFGLVHLVFTPSMSLLPILVTDHFQGGAVELAWLQSAIGIGGVTGGLVLGVWGGFNRRIMTSMGGLALLGVSMAVIGIAPTNTISIAIFGMFSAGFMVTMVVAARQSIIQKAVPPVLQGRVYTLIVSGWAIMDPIGLAIAGPASDVLGVKYLYLFSSIVMISLGIGAFFVPTIMNVEESQYAV